MAYTIAKKIAAFGAKIAPKLVTIVLFRHHIGYWPDLKNPKSLNEKLQYLKLNKFRNNPLITECVDKYAVRNYVKRKGCAKYLTKLIGVWDNANEIDFSKLPNEFVLKCNHGSGTNIICKDKKSLNIEDVRNQLDTWMKEDFGDYRAELIYDNVPHKIICEELINTNDGKPPKDYKFFCGYGKAQFLFVASDRYDGNTKFDYYDIDWNWIPVENGHPNAGNVIQKPDKFDEMVTVAEKLSEDFPLVRVDLYNENGRIIFGELTFLHHSGLCPYSPREFDFEFGEKFDYVVSKKL